MASLILAKELADRGHQVEIWNLGCNSVKESSDISTYATVKSINKLSLYSYRHSEGDIMLLVNNAGNRYAPKKNCVSIIHGDPTYRLRDTESLTTRLKSRLKIYLDHYYRPAIIISAELGRRLSPYTKHEPKYIPNPFHAQGIIKKSQDPRSVDLPEKFIVHVGRIAPEKRQYILLNDYLEHAELPKKTELVFVGAEIIDDGPLMAQMIKMREASSWSQRVHFLGDQSNPWNIIKYAQCLVLCSEFESMGYVLLEAMALNIPIVATTTVGTREVLGHEFPGLVVDSESLSERISQAISSPEQFIKQLPSRYDHKNVVDEFEKYLASL